MDYENYLNDYFELQPQKNWSSFENFDVIRNYSQNLLSPEVQYLIKNKIDFDKIFGKEEVDNVLKRIAGANSTSADKKKVKAAQKILEDLSK